jgi:NAD(P)-dependent dehydrogenase (short-subunit alcohol dehydrogenase family)
VDIADRVVVILGGSGLVGSAIARRLIPMTRAG